MSNTKWSAVYTRVKRHRQRVRDQRGAPPAGDRPEEHEQQERPRRVQRRQRAHRERVLALLAEHRGDVRRVRARATSLARCARCGACRRAGWPATAGSPGTITYVTNPANGDREEQRAEASEQRVGAHPQHDRDRRASRRSGSGTRATRRSRTSADRPGSRARPAAARWGRCRRRPTRRTRAVVARARSVSSVVASSCSTRYATRMPAIGSQSRTPRTKSRRTSSRGSGRCCTGANVRG